MAKDIEQILLQKDATVDDFMKEIAGELKTYEPSLDIYQFRAMIQHPYIPFVENVCQGQDLLKKFSKETRVFRVWALNQEELLNASDYSIFCSFLDKDNNCIGNSFVVFVSRVCTVAKLREILKFKLEKEFEYVYLNDGMSGGERLRVENY